MRITKKELEEFKEIYFKEFGVRLSNLRATKKALNVLAAVELVTKSSTISSGGLTREED